MGILMMQKGSTTDILRSATRDNARKTPQHTQPETVPSVNKLRRPGITTKPWQTQQIDQQVKLNILAAAQDYNKTCIIKNFNIWNIQFSMSLHFLGQFSYPSSYKSKKKVFLLLKLSSFLKTIYKLQYSTRDRPLFRLLLPTRQVATSRNTPLGQLSFPASVT